MPIFNRTAIQQSRGFYSNGQQCEPDLDALAFQAIATRHASSDPADVSAVAKRAFDIAIASVALIMLAPLLIIVAIAIKLDSRGPVFFVQERIGINRRRSDRGAGSMPIDRSDRSATDRRKNMHPGRPFRIYKFRTMVRDAERYGPALACENDPRVTRLGRFMRKTRIDELPQFLNVLRGEMSIIGPRPERSFYINQVRQEVPEFTMRLFVKPGITGLAQVENGYTSSIDEMKHKLFYDLKYIAEFSLWQEIRILFKTVSVVVTGKGAC
jgi:lipopolysaccharide/colanic/teichoic acid biosynthesis glycosyltransferase